MDSIDSDRDLIEALGGPAKVSELLGFEKNGGVQRVQNWTTRGIPAAIKVQHPDLFIPGYAGSALSHEAPPDIDLSLLRSAPIPEDAPQESAKAAA